MQNDLEIKSIAHITGGGLVDNIPRVLPENISLDININSWKKIPIFDFLKNSLDIDNEDLYQTFNMGIGLVLIVGLDEKDRALELLGENNCTEIGLAIKDGTGAVHLNEK
jgi:phosphoribosylformylglycinamidine cyclo-ligase